MEFQKFGNLKPGGVNLRNQKVRFPRISNQVYDILILLEPQNLNHRGSHNAVGYNIVG